MARYIDADALEEYIQETICAKCGDISDGIKCKSCGIDDTLDFLENAPTADVVPRSEVAREIFEEIEKIIDSHEITIGLVYDEGAGATTAIDRIHKKIAELKKKYTEK